MRVAPILAAFLLGFANAGHAALGGPPEHFDGQGTAIASRVTPAGVSYMARDTTLASGTHVSEYVTAGGLVFAVAWEGPILPDLKALLGRHFETMVAESTKAPKAGRSQVAVDLPEVVIRSGGHMRAFEGRAWIPSELPAGFSAADVH